MTEQPPSTAEPKPGSIVNEPPAGRLARAAAWDEYCDARDGFAAAALTGLCSHNFAPGFTPNDERFRTVAAPILARQAFDLAEEMMRERGKRNSKNVRCKPEAPSSE
jgi:hypothetical protein